jgi:hypothetical protein
MDKPRQTTLFPESESKPEAEGPGTGSEATGGQEPRGSAGTSKRVDAKSVARTDKTEKEGGNSDNWESSPRERLPLRVKEETEAEAIEAVQNATWTRSGEGSSKEVPICGTVVEVDQKDTPKQVILKYLVSRGWNAIRRVRDEYYGEVNQIRTRSEPTGGVCYCEGCDRIQKHMRLPSTKSEASGEAYDITCPACGTVAGRSVENGTP